MSAESRRELILQKAKALFASRGYASATLDEVAAAAGVTKPVVYDHFPSKRALYFALMRELRDDLLRQASLALGAACGAPQERLQAALESFYVQVRRDPALVELLFVQPRSEPELMHEWQRLQAEAMASLKPLVHALAPRLEPWQLNVVVSFLHHGLNATAEVWPRKVPAGDMARLVVKLLWKGLGNPP
jgi:AcrR family transcriptional regulator